MMVIQEMVTKMRLWHTKILAKRLPGLRYERAGARDVYYCYRLFLRRDPDAAGWKYWMSLIRNNQIDLQTLVDTFMSMEEFQVRQAAAQQETLVDLEGFRLYIRPNDYFIGAAIAREKQYEPAVTVALKQYLKPGQVFVDVGANIGYFTCLAAAIIGTKGHVYAFEPNPDNIQLIKLSIAANSFENVSLFPVAVAETDQEFKLDAGAASSNARIIDFSADAVPGLNNPLLIKAVTLDKTLAGVPKIDMVKLDIEGAEPRAWAGMHQLVKKHRPILLFEFSPGLIRMTSHVPPETLLDSILEAGYQLYILAEGDSRQKPRTRDEIVRRQMGSGGTHLDLLALPE